MNMEFTNSTQMNDVDVNSTNFLYASKCAYCNYDFADYTGKIYKCQVCDNYYYENCLNIQINELWKNTSLVNF